MAAALRVQRTRGAGAGRGSFDLTLGHFFLGLVTIAVATLVFRWQKEIEHAFSERAEKRILFGRFLGQLEAVVRRIDEPGLAMSQEVLQLEMILAEIELITDGEVITAAVNVLSRLYDVQRFNRDPEHSKLPNAASRYGHILSGQRGLVEAMTRDLERTVDSKTSLIGYGRNRLKAWQGRPLK